jgi:protoporphyrinogen oxidase
MEKIKNLIIGAGIAGLGASYSLKKRGESSLVLEQNNTYGGLSGSFEINGFCFDRFIHMSFAKDEEVRKIFMESTNGDIYEHESAAFNLYKGIWVKHPAQNNLFPLEQWEKDKIVDDFRQRPTTVGEIHNYEEWLRHQFGNYFAENFPMRYTRKYWLHEAKDLRTEWIGVRIYQPNIEEVIKGCNTNVTPHVLYTQELRYPKKGGFVHFLKSLADKSDIRTNSKVVKVDVDQKVVTLGDGTQLNYERLISSMPLPELINAIPHAPENVKKAASTLEATSGYHISVGFKGNRIPPLLYWYIYDEDILSARVFSPSRQSPNNAPEGCSSLQIEVYCREGQYTEKELIDGTIGKLDKLGVIHKEDILFTHIEFEKYANVTFTQPVYESRKVVRNYLTSVGIETIGRFGEWDYLWTDQSLLSGLHIK